MGMVSASATSRLNGAYDFKGTASMRTRTRQYQLGRRHWGIGTAADRNGAKHGRTLLLNSSPTTSYSPSSQAFVPSLNPFLWFRAAFPVILVTLQSLRGVFLSMLACVIGICRLCVSMSMSGVNPPFVDLRAPSRPCVLSSVISLDNFLRSVLWFYYVLLHHPVTTLSVVGCAMCEG